MAAGQLQQSRIAVCLAVFPIMLCKIRLTLAILFFVLITLLFLDFTGSVHAWLGWMARIQFLPALLAVNVGVILLWVVLTLLFGRVYCSVICPLGGMQDVIAWFGKRGKKKRYRYAYSPAKSWLRYGVLALFIVALIAGIGSVVALLAPYSAYGRIAQNLFAPVWACGNNILAYLAERIDSYAFYKTEVWVRSLPTFIVAGATLLILAVLAWRNGRTYCNTICPVGTVLGLLSRFSLFRPMIDLNKCNGCKLCSHRCKASCINPDAHQIDYSRCVVCMDCIGACRQGAISYQYRFKRSETVPVADHEKATHKTVGKGNAVSVSKSDSATSSPVEATAVVTKSDLCSSEKGMQTVTGNEQTNASAVASDTGKMRRHFLTGLGLWLGAVAVKAQEKKVDGGLAVILDKKIPERMTPIVPPGAQGLHHLSAHCTGCQLCVAVCPNGVLRPSTDPTRLMQPEMSYERGYCRPECTKCSEVCPAGAILPITPADKSSIQIGHAVWVKANCLPVTDGVSCGNCARHCPVGAIKMVPLDPNRANSPKIPIVNEERCIGCGACENLCPVRPFSAIYVEGHNRHRLI